MMTKNIKKIFAAGIVGCALSVAATSCSDSYMEDINTDDAKAESIEPSAQLTTALLQTYGDFGLMDTYRSYITGFTQHFAGGWNVTNYAGSVHAFDDQTRLVWNQFYAVSVKNLVDAIANSADKPAVNAALRIHYVYLMSVLTDIYGDVPCLEAGKGYTEGITNPKYDTQEEIYNFFFTELTACAAQLAEGGRIGGDVTSMSGDATAWRRYANSLRMRFAMRISDVNPAKAKEEFEKALKDEGGYISSADQDAYIIYTDGPFTLYDGSRDLDFRVNALAEILYGQDPTSPTLICSTFFNMMQDNNDPRLYRIARHYLNTKRSEIKPDREWNVDLTDEVLAYFEKYNLTESPCNPGAAWYNDWINAPDDLGDIPTLQKLMDLYPQVGFNESNFPARLLRPWLNIDFEMPQCPGFLITSAEVEFLLAEAKSKGWSVDGDVESHFKKGVTASMQILNTHYLQETEKISDAEINDYIAGITAGGKLASNPREVINTQAWILHTTNPSEAWSNLRRSDYPVLMDRTKLGKFEFTYDDPNMQTPVRLCYPILEKQYNAESYKAALDRMGGTDDWHHRLWWDTADINVK